MHALLGVRPTGDATRDIGALLAWRDGGVTFVELLRWLPYLKGARDLTLEGNTSLLLWRGVGDEMIRAIGELNDRRLIELRPTNPLTYVLDGFRSTLPTASTRRHYKSQRWLPVIVAPSVPVTLRAV